MLNAKLAPYLDKLKDWWKSQLEQSQSISAGIAKYQSLQERDKKIVNIFFGFLLLLVLWGIANAIINKIDSVDKKYQKAIADRQLLIKGMTNIMKQQAQNNQLIDATKLEAVVQAKSQKFGVVGNISAKSAGQLQIKWTNIDNLPQILLLVDSLSATGILIESLRATDGNITLLLRSQ